MRTVVAVAAAAAVVASAGCGGDQRPTEEAAPPAETTSPGPRAEEGTSSSSVAEPTTGGTVEFTIVDLVGYAGGDVAGVVTRDVDGLVVGGFATRISDDPFTTTVLLRRPAEADGLIGAWPHVTDEEAFLSPGEYVLTLWVDTGLGAYTRWFPLNTDARGLAGCVQAFTVNRGSRTSVVVGGDVQSTGYLGVCEPTTAATEAPPEFDQWYQLPAAMDPVSGIDEGPSLSVTVSGVSGRMGDEFAAVLYEGGDLSDLDREALGGFWAVISSDDQSLTEVVRSPGEFGVGRFPYVSDTALTVDPGTYTLVLWVDEVLTPVSRWVPINSYLPGDPLTEGMDLFGCHLVVDVGDDALTDVVVPANLHHNGWNVDCVTEAAIPGTDAAAAVRPLGSP